MWQLSYDIIKFQLLYIEIGIVVMYYNFNLYICELP